MEQKLTERHITVIHYNARKKLNLPNITCSTRTWQKMLWSGPRKFWSSLCSKSAKISLTNVSDDDAILRSPEMAVQFNDFFSSAFTSEEPFSKFPSQPCSPDTLMCI